VCVCVCAMHICSHNTLALLYLSLYTTLVVFTSFYHMRTNVLNYVSNILHKYI
jgi:hypothetical protein